MTKRRNISPRKLTLHNACIHAYKLHESFGLPISVVRFEPGDLFSYIATDKEGKYRLRHRRMRVYYRTGEGHEQASINRWK